MAGAGTYALLTDGSTVEIRPASPADAGAVQAMHAQMSPGNLYLRFFSLSPHSARREAERVTRPPDAYHAALLAWLGGRLVGVASYEPTPVPGTAEVAFAVSDDMHHRGIATLLLEHLVSLARRRGLAAFTATTLLENAAMLRVFAEAGLPVRRKVEDGAVELTFPLPLPGDQPEGDEVLAGYLDSVASRESRADVASLRSVLEPRSVAVIGASRRPRTVGRAILHNLVAGGFAGPVCAVNPQGQAMEGIPCVPTPGRPARAGRPGRAHRAGGGRARGGRGVRPPGRAGPGGDHVRPGHRGRRPAGHLPPPRHAPARPQLPGRPGPRARAQRHLHRGPGPARHRRAGGAVGRGGDRPA
jgi:GNAT superfamily N-acetyltransferase